MKNTVLIVDDIYENINLAANILFAESIDVIFNQTGKEAVESAQKYLPDLILLDVMMPEMNGFEVCKAIKQNINTQHIPIIFLTAKNDEATIVKGFNVGAVDYITKPFLEQELIMRVNNQIKLQEQKKKIIRSEKKYKSLFEESPIGMYRTNEKGEILLANKALVEMLEYDSLEDLKNSIDLINNSQNHVKNRESFIKKIKKSGKIFEFVNIWYTKHNNPINVIENARVYSSQNGKETYFEGSVENVTAKLKAQNEIIESENRLNTILNSLQESVFIVDPFTQEIEQVNPAGKNTFNIPENQESKLSCTELICGINCTVCPYVDKHEIILNQELELKKLNGETVTVLKSVVPVKINNQLKLIESITDITKRKNNEKALIESNEKYKHLIEKARSAIIKLDQNGCITFMNEYAAHIFEYTEQEVLGKPILGLLIPVKETQNNQAQQKFDPNLDFSPKKCDTIQENENITKSGKKIWMAWSNKAILDQNGNIAEVISIGTDITERRKSDEQIRKLSTAVEQNPAVIVITDIDGGIEFVNPKFKELTGYTLDEVRGQNTSVLKSGKTPKETIKSLWTTLAKDKVWKGEFINVKKNGEEFIEQAVISPIKNAEGKTTNYIALKEDITEKKAIQAELNKYKEHLEELIHKRTEELRLSEKNFKTLFEKNNDTIIINDRDGTIIDVNEAALKMLEYTHDEFLKLNTVDFVPSKYKAQKLKLYQNLKEGEHVTFQTENITKNGRIFNVEVRSTLIDYYGRKVILSAGRDITERLQAEKLKLDTIIQTEEKERSRFAKDLHDGLGATLSAIKMYLNIVKRSEPGSEKAESMLNEAITLIDKAGKSAKEIAVNIRPHDLTHFGLKSSLENFIDRINQIGTLKVNLETHKLNLTLDKDIELQLFRTVNELINNTFKYAEAQNINISLSNTEKKVILYYSDDGKGFYYDKIIKSNKSGIGLENITNRAKLAGGFAIIKSKPGEGMSAKIVIHLNNIQK